MHKFKSENEALQFYNLKQAPDFDKKKKYNVVHNFEHFLFSEFTDFFLKLEYKIYIRRPVESKTSVLNKRPLWLKNNYSAEKKQLTEDSYGVNIYNYATVSDTYDNMCIKLYNYYDNNLIVRKWFVKLLNF